MTQKYTTVIVEDDIKSAKLLTHYIDVYCPKLELVDTIHSINEAILLIEKIKPDIVFLDIMIHDDLIFELLDIINYSDFQIIFISSFEKFAIQTIKYSPVDYLLKPFKISDFVNSVQKAVGRLEVKSKQINNKDYIAVLSGQEIILLNYTDILCCKARGNYTAFCLVGSKTILALNNIGFFEKKLPDAIFCRIHKRHIVNFNHIKSIHKTEGFYCQLSDDSTLSISRRQHIELQKKLGLK